MKLRYNKSGDVMYIEFQGAKVANTKYLSVNRHVHENVSAGELS